MWQQRAVREERGEEEMGRDFIKVQVYNETETKLEMGDNPGRIASAETWNLRGEQGRKEKGCHGSGSSVGGG